MEGQGPGRAEPGGGLRRGNFGAGCFQAANDEQSGTPAEGLGPGHGKKSRCRSEKALEHDAQGRNWKSKSPGAAAYIGIGAGKQQGCKNDPAREEAGTPGTGRCWLKTCSRSQRVQVASAREVPQAKGHGHIHAGAEEHQEDGPRGSAISRLLRWGRVRARPLSPGRWPCHRCKRALPLEPKWALDPTAPRSSPGCRKHLGAGSLRSC
mmetsp:Transcript_40017/g.81953  ORF Transcript_40017/g.81953 Transcript_40017/m.81953 type:complete len:208 (+) Transcript_40017:123-746(+)